MPSSATVAASMIRVAKKAMCHRTSAGSRSFDGIPCIDRSWGNGPDDVFVTASVKWQDRQLAGMLSPTYMTISSARSAVALAVATKPGP